MKKLIIPIVALLTFGFTSEDEKLTAEERANAVMHLKKSQNHLMTVLDGIDDEQLDFKPTEDAWSIAENVEHLAISENAFGGLIQKTVAEGDDPSKKASMGDDELVGIITNRTQKVKTGEAFEPSGKFGSHEETLEAFNKKRNEHIDYVKTTDDDLRKRFNSDLPFGTVDAYQLLLFTAGHTERHIAQMKEIMDHEDFPLDPLNVD